jgi:chromosomal replication initiator protein
MEMNDIWQAALGELELTLSKANFTTWFKNTFISSFENGRMVISVPNTFTKAWLEKKYHDAIVRALRNATMNNVREVSYRVDSKPMGQSISYASEAPVAQEDGYATSQNFQDTAPRVSTSKSDASLNPRLTFSTFVVGKANELAHAAAQAVAGKPGDVYNPLYIYGGPGLGKTHLLHAIGHHIQAQRPDVKILYTSCERFISDYVTLIRTGRQAEFKNMYRTVDVLLLDDVQFMSGKEGTQEEFFHTFNALHQANKQIVITSDRQPKDIQGLEQRLISRFEWGMTTDVSSPDFETRVAILEAKTREKGVNIGSDILRYVAGTVQTNIRELEGALNKIIAYQQFKNAVPTLATVQSLLQSLVPTVPKRSITPRRLIEVVVGYYDLEMEDMLGKSREQRLAFPRQIAMYLLREEAKCSFPAIGGHLGGRDHTTAMHACSKIADMLKENEQLRQDISLIREKIYAAIDG